MRVAIDLSGLQETRVGVDRYMLGLISGLAELDEDVEFRVFAPRGEGASFAGRPANFSVHAVGPRPRPALLGFQQLALPALTGGGSIDVLHSPGVHMPLLRGRCRHLLTVHDLTQISLPNLHTRLRGSAPYRWMLRASIARADMVVVPTKHVRADLLRRTRRQPSNVRAIPHGLAPVFGPGAADRAAALLARLDLRGPLVLSVGTLEPRKSLGTLLDAFERLDRSATPSTLVLAGTRGWRSRALHEAIDAAPAGRVRWLGHVSDEDLACLYAAAAVFVYPSFEEGFGFPPLEAMASGTPVIASDTSAMAENLRGAAELVPPRDPGALAAALTRLLGDESRRSELSRQGLERADRFRRQDSARAHLALYRELAAA